jgi:50S ribosomal protein L16 3-hydroxylase
MTAMLGGLEAREFLTRYWQKRPLLLRGAVPDAERVITKTDLLELACRDDVEARFVSRRGARWSVMHAPLGQKFLAGRQGKRWTVLVNGVDHHNAAAANLLQRVRFIPHARLDDVMVSFATDGGGVGAHVDSYDVMLIQAMGLRRWEIGRQRNVSLIEGAPLKLLQDFTPDAEYLLEPGDLLYLPPNYAHRGTAVGECLTISIGFRAPGAAELGGAYLDHLHDELRLRGEWRDPDLRPTKHPGLIDDACVARAWKLICAMGVPRRGFDDFLGRYLSEPRANVYFVAPARPLSLARFHAAAGSRGVCLNPSSRVLYRAKRVFVNGEGCTLARGHVAAIRRLADDRQLPPPLALDAAGFDLVYAWYRLGYLEVCRGS